MSIRKSIIFGLLCLLAVVFNGCSSELMLESELLSDTPIRIEAGLLGSRMTRTMPNTDIQNRAFDGGEQISVYISTDEDTPRAVGRMPITCTTSSPSNYINALTPDYQTYYPQSTAVNIYAVYPKTVAPEDGGTTVFTVGSAQSEATYKQNDLMHARLLSQPKTDQTVRLQFSHKMAKIIVHVAGEDEVEIDKIKLTNVYRSVVFTPASGELGTLGSRGDIIIENHGAALIPEQAMNGETPFMEVETTLGQKVYFKTSKTFEAGKEYAVSLTIGRMSLGQTATITDWIQDGGRQIVEQTTSDGYTISYTQSVTFEENFRTSPYTMDDLVIKETATSKVLSRDTEDPVNYDYSVLFFGNDQAGTATMVINGNSTKDDTRNLSWVKSFTIKQATGSLTYPAYSAATTYNPNYVNATTKLQVPFENGTTVNWPCTQVCDPGTATFVSTNTDVATVDQNGSVVMVGVGETTIMASSPGDGNYTAASTSYNLEVTKRTAASLLIVLTEGGSEVTNTTYTYNGQPYMPVVTVYDGVIDAEHRLQAGKHYTVGYSNNLNAGTATVTITGAGDYTGTHTKDFIINPITTTFTQSYDDVSMATNKTLSRPATINHLFGKVTYSSSNESVATVNSNGLVTTGSNTGSAIITISVAEPSPKNYTAANMTYKVTVADYNQSFGYTGNVQTFTCQKTGTYLLEVWGAQGGTANASFEGGGGAYVTGSIYLESGQKLYVYVGGQGGQSGAAGWNGGGSGSSNALSTGGGGATDISICNGTWDSESHLKSRIIVAGGGGGSLYYTSSLIWTSGYATGGRGGAYEGRAGSGVSVPGKGGSLNGAGNSGNGNTSAGGFGFGGKYTGSGIAGAGGGGWYGGGAGGDSGRHGAGGGGSSYLWNSSNAIYYPGGSPLTTGSQVTDATKFYLTERGKSSGTNSGNGKAKITFLE